MSEICESGGVVVVKMVAGSDLVFTPMGWGVVDSERKRGRRKEESDAV